MDGIEATERIQEQFDVPVIYVTAFADEDTLTRAGLTQPYGYLQKPIASDELVATIEYAISEHGTNPS